MICWQMSQLLTLSFSSTGGSHNHHFDILMVAFSLLVKIIGEDNILFKVEISACTPIPLFLGQDQSKAAQQAKMMVTRCSLMSCM